MKFLLSYFYKVRFFKPNMIPISTAVSDPKWYHQNRGPQYTYFDKNNVINGLRCQELAPGHLCEGLCNGDRSKGCEPSSCQFLSVYNIQLEGHFDLPAFLQRCERAAEYVQSQNGFTEEPIIVLLVHEATDNPCSERRVLLDYFNRHGVPMEEFDNSQNI